MRIWKDQSGQVLVLTALSMTMMLGFMGFAVDVGQLFHAKRSLQAAVDDAAISGAIAYKNDTGGGGAASSTHIQNAAKAALAANGITGVTVTSAVSSNVTTPTLAVMSPPTDGPNSGTASFVEAVLTVPEGTTFMSIFGFNSINVTTRAVAGNGSQSAACIYVLNPDGSQQMYMGGKFTVNAPGCGIVINSTDPCALYFNGGGQGKSSTLSAGWVAVAGGACQQVSDSDPAPVTYSSSQVADPLAATTTVPGPSNCGTSDSTSTITANYDPSTKSGFNGVVCFPNTVTITGTGTAGSCTSSTYLNLGSAIYVFEKGVIFNGGCIDSPSGVTLDLYGNNKQGSTYNSLNVTTQTQFNLTAPSTAISCSTGCGNNTTYGNENIVFEQPASNYTGVININQGTATGTITGIIYAPTGELYVQDQGAGGSNGIAMTFNADLVVGSFNDQASDVTINSLQSSSGTQLTHVTLVE
jgi:Flp pilus assembly protein TadG